MSSHPQFLYKILSLDDWKNSGETLHLPPADTEFIHFSTDDQLPKIIEKYWNAVPEFLVLKIERERLIGDLIFEANPGGVTKYYHLYHGSIPRDAIIESTIIRH